MRSKIPTAVFLTGLVVFLFCGTPVSRAAENKQPTTQQIYEEALRAYYRGDLPSAKAGLERVLRTDPRHTTARGYLARINYKIKSQGKNGPPALEKQMSQVIVPSVEFEDASLGSVLDYLSEKASEVTSGQIQPNFIYRGPAEELKRKKVTFKLRNAPVNAILEYIGDQTDTKFSYDKYAIVATPKRDTIKTEKSAKEQSGEGSLDPGVRRE